MAWTGVPITTTSGVEWLIYITRAAINDQKLKLNQAVEEINDSGCLGINNEMFHTRKLPIATGYDTQMFTGRWVYEEAANISEASGGRFHLFNVPSGTFTIPSGAVLGLAGSIVKLSYAYTTRNKYKWSDDDLKYVLERAVTEVNNGYYDFGYRVISDGGAYTIDPSPSRSGVGSYVYSKYATYLIRKQMESSGFDKRIKVKDLNTSIDTTAGLGELRKSSETMLDEINFIINELRMADQLAAFGAVDKYTTYNAYAGDYQGSYNKDTDFYGA